MDPLLRGLYGIPAKLKMPREIMNSELTEKLFHITRIVSQDLASLNIQVDIHKTYRY
jgi:peroxidase